MNETGFRVCAKELYETRYDPVSVNYAVLAGQLISNEKVRHIHTVGSWFTADKHHVLISRSFTYVTSTYVTSNHRLAFLYLFRNETER